MFLGNFLSGAVLKKPCACCIFYPKIIALIKKSVNSCLIKSQLNSNVKLYVNIWIFQFISFLVTVGQLCANISELCLEIVHTYASDSCMFHFLNYTLKCGFPKKSFNLNAPLVIWAYMSSLLDGCNNKPTQKWWQICLAD